MELFRYWFFLTYEEKLYFTRIKVGRLIYKNFFNSKDRLCFIYCFNFYTIVNNIKYIYICTGTQCIYVCERKIYTIVNLYENAKIQYIDLKKGKNI